MDIIIWIAIFAFAGVIILVMFLRHPKSREDEIEKLLSGERHFEDIIDRDTLKNLLQQGKITNAQLREWTAAEESRDPHRIYSAARDMSRLAADAGVSVGRTIRDILKDIRHIYKTKEEIRLLGGQGTNVSGIIKILNDKLIKKTQELQYEKREKQLQEMIDREWDKIKREVAAGIRAPRTQEEFRELLSKAAQIAGRSLTIERSEEAEDIPVVWE